MTKTTYKLERPCIGQRIKAGMVMKGLSIAEFAQLINCNRSNVYHIFQRKSIDSGLLTIISKVLDRNFLLEMGMELEQELEKIEIV